MSWRRVQLSEVLIQQKETVELKSNEEYTLVTISKTGAITKRETKKGVEIKGKSALKIKSGDFIYSRLAVHSGAFGIIPKELNDAIVTNEMPSFVIKDNILPEFLIHSLTLPDFSHQITHLTKGVGRTRVKEKSFLGLEINLPTLSQQKQIVTWLASCSNISDNISANQIAQLDLVKQLRQAFLREAMQGKLVSQDPNDEPASVLLEKIKGEKELLVKEKKIKKQKPLPQITEDEIPFEIPENWVWCRLGDSGDLKRGKSKHRPRNDNKLFEGGEYPFIQTGDVARSKSNGYIIETINGYYNDFGLAQSEIQPMGTLCITIAANIAECGFLGFDACAPDSIVCYSSLDRTIDKYAFYYLIDAREEIEKYAPATAQKNINLGILNSLLIPLPPLSEQQRIIAKLDELMAYCDELEASIKENQQQNELLLQQVLREALEPKNVEQV